MEAILRLEVNRLQQQRKPYEVSLNVMLNNTVFHKSLLACALEVVLLSHIVPWANVS